MSNTPQMYIREAERDRDRQRDIERERTTLCPGKYCRNMRNFTDTFGWKTKVESAKIMYTLSKQNPKYFLKMLSKVSKFNANVYREKILDIYEGLRVNVFVWTQQSGKLCPIKRLSLTL